MIPAFDRGKLEKAAAMSGALGVATDVLLKGDEACARPQGKEGGHPQQDPEASRTAGWRQAVLILLLSIALLAALQALFF